jgi:hypothetical protein
LPASLCLHQVVVPIVINDQSQEQVKAIMHFLEGFRPQSVFPSTLNSFGQRIRVAALRQVVLFNSTFLNASPNSQDQAGLSTVIEEPIV